MQKADFVLICLSKHSVTKRGFLQREIREALDRWKEQLSDDIYIIPIRLEDCKVPQELARFHWVDLFQPYGIDALMVALQTGLARRKGPSVEPSPLTYQTERILEYDANRRYSVDISYPSLQPATETSLAEINKILHSIALRYLFDARKFPAIDELDRPTFSDEVPLPNSLWTSFEIHLLTADLISLEFQVSEYFAGAAHPMHHTRTHTFLRPPACEILTAELLRSDQDALIPIAAYCHENVINQFTQDGTVLADHDVNWIKEGTQPTADNYRAIVLTNDGATVFFDPYQVAAYAYGRIEVRIPRAILDPLFVPTIREVYLRVPI